LRSGRVNPFTEFFTKFLLISGELSRSGENSRNPRGYYAVVERLTKSDQAYAVAAAAAHGFNEELTVILSSVSHCLEALEPGHPARLLLLDLQVAAERCARTTSGLLAYSFSRGLRQVPTRFEALIAN
jgi:hypothetical protein